MQKKRLKSFLARIRVGAVDFSSKDVDSIISPFEGIGVNLRTGLQGLSTINTEHGYGESVWPILPVCHLSSFPQVLSGNPAGVDAGLDSG
jgi:hypothetical protein